jgi:peptidylprolyl isomerase
MEAMQRRAKRRQNVRRGVIVGIVAIVVLGTGALLFAGKTTTTTTTTSTAPTTTTTVAKPISFSPIPHPNAAGVWGKAPTLVVPAGKPPTKPELANLITGTGPGIAVGDSFTAEYILADYATHKVLQSSWPKPFSDTLTVGTPTVSGLISGWVAGMVGMKEGGRRELILPPDVAYGPSPTNGIADNDTLVFIIDLVKFKK